MEQAREMRAAGRPVAEIAAAVGVAKSTVCRWTTPSSHAAMMAWNEANRDKRRAADVRRARSHRSTCETCGGPCGVGSGKKGYRHCAGCVRAVKEARDAAIVCLYERGLPVKGIAAAMDSTANSITVTLVDLRGRGLIGYRYSAYERRAVA